MFTDLAKGRDNNFQLLRLLAAAAVIVSHAFPIAWGSAAYEPRLYGVTLGTVAVWVFFALSGFLISKSFERHPVPDFVEARVLRIYPALIVVALISVLVIGPLFTSLPLRAYFSARETIEYVPRALSLKFVSFSLPGVFDGNPFPAVNGPLWTLWYEVSCYAALAIGLAVLRRFSFFLVAYAVLFPFMRHTLYADLSLAFVTGMTLYHFRSSIPAHLGIAAMALAAAWFVPAIAPVAIAYAALWFANWKWRPLLAYNRVGDYSYGLYIYGWPVEEIVAALFKGISPAGVIAIALPAALLCATASWYLVERPALARKGLMRRIGALRPSRHRGLVNAGKPM